MAWPGRRPVRPRRCAPETIRARQQDGDAGSCARWLVAGSPRSGRSASPPGPRDRTWSQLANVLGGCRLRMAERTGQVPVRHPG